MRKFVSFILLFFMVLSEIVYAQDDTINNPLELSDTLQDNFGLFASNEVLEISLRFDLRFYTRKKPKNEYLNALLTYYINENDSINKKVRIKSRGEFRNSYCHFPPIALNLKKSKFEKNDLQKIRKLKMVTHCRAGNEINILKEYLIYRMYNILTDTSFRVRLLKINYINTHKNKNKIFSSYGFVIEPVESLGERIVSVPIKKKNLTQKNIDPLIMDRMAIFNYMIGNTDWSVPNQHNCKVFSHRAIQKAELGIIIPYDFDYSGLVNTSYAIPHEDLGIKSVTERLFLGMCRSENEYQNSLNEFLEKKDDFYELINNFDYLNQKTKKSMINYLNSFYAQFDKRNTIIQYFQSNCKKL